MHVHSKPPGLSIEKLCKFYMENKERALQQDLFSQKRNSYQTHSSHPLRATRCPYPSITTSHLPFGIHYTSLASGGCLPGPPEQGSCSAVRSQFAQPQSPSFTWAGDKLLSKCWNKRTPGCEHHGKNFISQCYLSNFRKEPLNYM